MRVESLITPVVIRRRIFDIFMGDPNFDRKTTFEGPDYFFNRRQYIRGGFRCQISGPFLRSPLSSNLVPFETNPQP